MSKSTFELRVESDEPLSTVEIVDGRYRLIDQKPRSVTVSLPPGLYVTRVKYPDRVQERLIEHGAAPTLVSFGRDLSETTNSRRQHEVASGVRHMHQVRSAQLRTWITVSFKAPGLGELPETGRIRLPDWSAFSVCTLDGLPVVQPVDDSSPSETNSDPHERILSHGLAVGWYTLRIPSRDGVPAYLPLYVSPRFSPTVLLEVGGIHEGQMWFDFDRLVVSYDELEGGAYADPLRLEALRAARRSLQLGRNGLTSELMQVLYEQKFSDPMLGLFALQLLLLRAKPSLSESAEPVRQFRTVMANMARALKLPEHPDLVLARAQARRLKWPVQAMDGDDAPLIAPPLLRANWDALVATSSRRQELLDPNRLLRRVGEGLLQSGIWVMWKPPAQRSVGEEIGQILTRALGSAAVKPTDPTAPKKRNRPVPEHSESQRASTTGRFTTQRPSRAIDIQLEEVVDQVRAHPLLRKALQARLQVDRSSSTVLERALCRAVLQLAEAEVPSERNVPAGFAKRLARDLAVPFVLVGETVRRMRKELKGWSLASAAALTIERTFLP